MSIKRCKTHSTSKINLFTSRSDSSLGHMKFGKSKVNDVHSVSSRVKNKVRCFHISVNESCIMHKFNSVKHLNQYLSGIWSCHSLIRKVFLDLRQIRTKKFHYYEVCISLVVDEIINLGDVFLSLQNLQNLVLKLQNTRTLVCFLYLESNIFV